MNSPPNGDGRPEAAVNERRQDHPDSIRQHEPSSRGRSRQHDSVDLVGSIGTSQDGRACGDGSTASPVLRPSYVAAVAENEERHPRRTGRFEWERAFREAGIECFPGAGIDLDRVKAYGLLLASFANAQGGDAFPSQATLAEYLGSNERNARKYLRAIEGGGWIVGERRGRQRTTRYRLVLPDRRGDAGQDAPDDGSYVVEHRRRSAGVTGVGAPPTTTDTTTAAKTPKASSPIGDLSSTENESDAVARDARSGPAWEVVRVSAGYEPVASFEGEAEAVAFAAREPKDLFARPVAA